MSEKRKAEEFSDPGARKMPRTDGENGRPAGTDAERSPEEFLEQFQKEAMWRQLQAYKRESDAAVEEAREAHATKERSDRHLDLLLKSLATLHDEIRMAVRVVNAQEAIKGELSGRGKDPFARLLEGLDTETLDPAVKDIVKQTKNLLQELRSGVDRSLEAWKGTVSMVEAALTADDRQSSVVKALEMEVARLQRERSVQREALEDMEERARQADSEALAARSDHDKARKRIRDVEQKLAEARSKLAATEKKLDRLRCPTTAAVAVAVKDPGIKAEASSVDIKMEEDPNELSKFREQLTEMAALAEARLRAIQELEDEKKRLRDDLHDARYSHVSGNDDRSDRDAAYKDLYAHYMFVKKELEMVEDSRKKRDEEFNELRAGSVNFRKQIEAEEAQRRKPLEAEVRRLEADVNRLRAGRDQAQQLLEVRESKDKAEIIQNHEIRVIANTRKDRIDALEIENQRLRIKLAAIGGSREMVDVFNELAPEDAVSEIQSRYLKAQSQIEHLGRLAKSLGASERQLQDIAALNTATRSLFSPKNERVLDPKEYETLIQQLELRCDQYQKTEAKLLAELDALGNAWTQLEEQNSRKVLDLTSKEDELIKCHAERTKLEAKIITMQKQQSTLNNVALALKKQSDKQLEQIRRLEELEKSLLQQIAHLEREVSARQTLVDGHKRKNAELVQQFNESKERNERLNGKLGDVLSTLKEKVAALDSENRARRDMEEELAKVNKKLEVAKADPGAGDGGELSRQLEEYKALLKCPTCNKSFKDTILLKCMHTFCKTCIDTIYDSRQRKCPTCGIAFGQSDVKPMYL